MYAPVGDIATDVKYDAVSIYTRLNVMPINVNR